MSIETTPHHREYKEKTNLGKEVLKKTIDEITKLDARGVVERLEKYKEIIPGMQDTNINSFEMMALYQRSLILLGARTKDIDALFGPETHKELKKVQETKLGLKGKDVDGLPGPTTTKAIIKELEKQSTPTSVPVAPAKAAAETTELPPTQKAIEYLTKTEHYSDEGDGVYMNPDEDMTIRIKDGKAEATRILGKRLFGDWDYSEREVVIMRAVDEALGNKKK